MGARGTPSRFLIDGEARLDFTLGRHPSESPERTVLRALARVLFPDPDLEPGGELCRGDEPAWRAPAPGGRDRLRIVIGGPAPRPGRDRARAERTVRVRAGELGRALPYGEDVVVDAPFVGALAARLGRRNVWTVTRSNDELVVRTEGETLRGGFARSLRHR